MSNWAIQTLSPASVSSESTHQLSYYHTIYNLLSLKMKESILTGDDSDRMAIRTHVFSLAYGLNVIFTCVILFLLKFTATTHDKSATEFQLWIIIFSQGSCAKAHLILSPWEKIVSRSTRPQKMKWLSVTAERICGNNCIFLFEDDETLKQSCCIKKLLEVEKIFRNSWVFMRITD